MLQQVTLKGLRIPHSGFRIPDSLPSTNPTKTWPLLPLLRWVKTIATWKAVIESMQFISFRYLLLRSKIFELRHLSTAATLWIGNPPSA